MQLKIMFCPKCGNDIENGSSYCKNCGARIESTPQSAYQAGVPPQYILPLKSSGIAAILSFIIPGAGVIYAGQIGKGLLYFIIGIIVSFATIMLLPFIVVFLIFWVWQIYDAYNITEEYNQILQTTGQKPW
ncbi:zinc ribbon domain-containing protein [Candidatus Methanomassiliicoccus intestinalis]